MNEIIEPYEERSISRTRIKGFWLSEDNMPDILHHEDGITYQYDCIVQHETTKVIYGWLYKNDNLKIYLYVSND
jgi:hypothetical protein